MPDPTPEERAKALRLAEDWADRWTGHHPTGLAAEPLAMARALLAAESERAELAREVEELRGALDCLNYAWTIICNVSGGDWTKQTQEWQDAAARLRDQYHALLDRAALSEPMEGEHG